MLLKNYYSFLPIQSERLPLPSLTIIGPFGDETEQIYGDYSPTPDPDWTISVAQGLSQLVNGQHMKVVKGCSDGPPCLQYERDAVIAAAQKEPNLLVLALGIAPKGILPLFQKFWT